MTLHRLSTIALCTLATGSVLLAGCTTAPETRVTRFHIEPQIARGQIAVEPLSPADVGSLEFQNYASIVGAELARIGFTEAPGLAKSEQVAVVGVERTSRAGARRSAFSIGLGGGSYGYRGGVGGGVSVPVAGGRPSDITVTRLFVRIKRRSDGTVVWEGRAETAAPADRPESQPDTAVHRLAAALFSDFPGVSNRTVIVK